MWSLNYCLLVFLAVLGVLQLAAVHNDLYGLLLFPGKIFSLVFGGCAIGFALFAFFTWYDFKSIVVEGSQQTGSFVLSGAVAIIFTLVGSSLLNYRRFHTCKLPQDGLDALRECTYFQVVRNHRNGKKR